MLTGAEYQALLLSTLDDPVLEGPFRVWRAVRMVMEDFPTLDRAHLIMELWPRATPSEDCYGDTLADIIDHMLEDASIAWIVEQRGEETRHRGATN